MGRSFINREAATLSGEPVDFSFGQNWRKYLDRLDERQIRFAEIALRRSFAGHDLRGERLIDVGCGSGVFSLAAWRLGAARIVSLDIDPYAVACVRSLRTRESGSADWQVQYGSVLDRQFLEKLEPAARVYCWGVLHHTGAMWRAVEHVLELVAPGGLCCLALYNWPRYVRPKLTLKRFYNRLPRPMRPPFAWFFGAAQLARWSLRGDNPLKYVRDYPRQGRGMSFWRDVEDWLGGLPVEYSTEGQVEAFATARGFIVERVQHLGSGGVNEYLLRRQD